MRRIIDLATKLAVLVAAARAAMVRGQNQTTESGPKGQQPIRLPNGHRGRSASRPSAIPARGWKDVLVRVVAEMKEDNLTMVAAAMTYYGVLALFPALIAVVSLYGLVADAAAAQAQVADLTAILPGSAAELINSQLAAIVESSNAALGLGFAVSLAATFWSVSSGVAALIKAINLAYDETETRGFVQLRMISLALTTGLILFVVAAIFVITVLPLLLGAVGVSSGLITAASWLRWPVLGIALIGALAAFYRFGPNRDPAKWRWLTWGAAAAAIVWLAASVLLNFYVSNFGSYNETYGALGGVIVLLLWMFVSALIVLLGAELDAELEAQTGVDTTTGPPEPMGERNAIKADNLGKPAELVDA